VNNGSNNSISPGGDESSQSNNINSTANSTNNTRSSNTNTGSGNFSNGYNIQFTENQNRRNVNYTTNNNTNMNPNDIYNVFNSIFGNMGDNMSTMNIQPNGFNSFTTSSGQNTDINNFLSSMNNNILSMMANNGLYSGNGRNINFSMNSQQINNFNQSNQQINLNQQKSEQEEIDPQVIRKYNELRNQIISSFPRYKYSQYLKYNPRNAQE
jgi:hypothetical protein